MPKKKGKAKAGAAAEGSAAPVRAKAHQSRLEVSFEKKLKAPRDDINHVIGVPYDHWNYASSAAGKAEEAHATETGTFKCKVVDFELSKRFPATAGKAAFISLILKIPQKWLGASFVGAWLWHPCTADQGTAMAFSSRTAERAEQRRE